MHAETLKGGWRPLEEFRAAYSGEPFGVWFSGDNNDFAELPMRVSTHLALFQLHGNYHKEWSIHAVRKALANPSYDYKDRPLARLWQVYDWLDWDAETRTFFYYDNQKVVVQEPDHLLSSAFVSGDGSRAVVCISNLDTEPVKNARVALDFDGMGMKGRSITVEDAYLGTVFDIDNGRLLLDEIKRERYRLLKITAE